MSWGAYGARLLAAPGSHSHCTSSPSQEAFHAAISAARRRQSSAWPSSVSAGRPACGPPVDDHAAHAERLRPRGRARPRWPPSGLQRVGGGAFRQGLTCGRHRQHSALTHTMKITCTASRDATTHEDLNHGRVGSHWPIRWSKLSVSLTNACNRLRHKGMRLNSAGTAYRNSCLKMIKFWNVAWSDLWCVPPPYGVSRT